MRNKNIIFLIIILTSFILSASFDHDAEYLKKSIIYKLNADGSSMFEYHSRIKLHTYRATNRIFGESFIKYNPDFQKLEILLSETTMKDGKKVKSPKNAYNEVLPSRAKKFPHFAGLKEMVVTHVGIERGAVIEFKYRLYTKAGLNTYFSGLEYLSEQYPVNELKIVVTHPASKKMNISVTKFNDLLLKKINGDNIEYSLSLNSIGKFNNEPLSNNANRAYLVFSDAEQWSEIFPGRYADKDIPEKLIKDINMIKKSTSSKLEKLFKIQKLFVSDSDLCRLDHRTIGNRVRGSKQVYNSNYATGPEKAYLLSGVLERAGIKNEILVSLKNGPADKLIPSHSLTGNYFIKIIDYCDKPVFIDTVHLQNNTLPLSLQGKLVYNLNTKKIRKIKKYDNNKIKISGNIKLKGKDYKGKLFVEFSGVNFNYKSSLKLRSYIKKSLSKYINVKKILEIKVVNHSINSISAEVKLEGKFLKEINKGYLMLDKFNFSPISKRDSFLTKRSTPLILDSTNMIELDLNVKYPEKMTVDYMIKEKMIKNDLGVFINKIKKNSKGLVSIKYVRSINRSIIDPSDYLKFKKILDNINRSRALLIFTEK